jgi:hypothetical protein
LELSGGPYSAAIQTKAKAKLTDTQGNAWISSPLLSPESEHVARVYGQALITQYEALCTSMTDSHAFRLLFDRWCPRHPEWLASEDFLCLLFAAVARSNRNNANLSRVVAHFSESAVVSSPK